MYGQGGSFALNEANNGGISATSLSDPSGVTVDAAGMLYIADSFNSRVLVFPTS